MHLHGRLEAIDDGAITFSDAPPNAARPSNPRSNSGQARQLMLDRSGGHRCASGGERGWLPAEPAYVSLAEPALRRFCGVGISTGLWP